MSGRGRNQWPSLFIVLAGSTAFTLWTNHVVNERQESRPTTLEVFRTEAYQGPSFSLDSGTHWVALTPTGAVRLRMNDYARLSRGGLHCVTTWKANMGMDVEVARVLHAGACRTGDAAFSEATP